MKIGSLIHIAALLSLWSFSSFSSPIVSGISTNEINIDTEFTGAKILLFGAREETGSVIIAVRGPKKNILVTKKERLLGIWYNGQRIRFDNSPTFYSLFSTKFETEATEQILQKLEIGTSNIKFIPTEKHDQSKKDEFQLQLISDMEKQHLYKAGSGNVDFLNETLFKVMLYFPKNIIQGVYTVEIYLIDDGSVLSFQSIPIYVNQVGLSAKVFNFAYQESFLYGLLAVFAALVFGWIVNYVFAKFIGK